MHDDDAAAAAEADKCRADEEDVRVRALVRAREQGVHSLSQKTELPPCSEGGSDQVICTLEKANPGRTPSWPA